MFFRNSGTMTSVLGMRFLPSECKVMLKDWIGWRPNLVIAERDLHEVDRFSYLDS